MARLEVAVYSIENHKRSLTCCRAMMQGIKASGDRPVLLAEEQYRGPAFPVAVFYGYTPTLRRVMADYIKAGLKAVYIDLGYWSREGLMGYHKISVNDRHPTAYFQKKKHRDDRMKAVNVSIAPWRKAGKYILLAGMGDKAAAVEGRRVESWERETIEAIRKVSGRRIIYRPKPSWLSARPIPGTIFSPKSESLDFILSDCHAVVTHHSNVAVEGLCAGVPAFCWKGVASPLALQDLARLEDPLQPDGREQWAADIAYTQWSVTEMGSGRAWQHLKTEGLI